MRDLDLKGIAIGGAIIFAGIVASLAAAWGVVAFSGAPAAGASGARPPQLGEPRLETAPRAALERFEREKRARLESSGPLEGEPGFGHIPIEEAMRRLAAQRMSFSENGRPVDLQHFLGGPPLVVQFGYLGCSHLCPVTLDGVDEALRATGLSAGRDYVALFISIDRRDEASPQGARPGWHLLTGAAGAGQLARRVGFQYEFEKASGEFAHPAGFYLLTPQGQLSGSFGGVRFDPSAVRARILEAAGGQQATTIQQLFLRCFHDPVSGRYSRSILDGLRIGALMFLAALGFYAWRRR